MNFVELPEKLEKNASALLESARGELITEEASAMEKIANRLEEQQSKMRIPFALGLGAATAGAIHYGAKASDALKDSDLNPNKLRAGAGGIGVFIGGVGGIVYDEIRNRTPEQFQSAAAPLTGAAALGGLNVALANNNIDPEVDEFLTFYNKKKDFKKFNALMSAYPAVAGAIGGAGVDWVSGKMFGRNKEASAERMITMTLSKLANDFEEQQRRNNSTTNNTREFQEGVNGEKDKEKGTFHYTNLLTKGGLGIGAAAGTGLGVLSAIAQEEQANEYQQFEYDLKMEEYNRRKKARDRNPSFFDFEQDFNQGPLKPPNIPTPIKVSKAGHGLSGGLSGGLGLGLAGLEFGLIGDGIRYLRREE